MFRVQHSLTGMTYEVYDVQVTDDGEVCFLIYDYSGYWIYVNSKVFRPITKED